MSDSMPYRLSYREPLPVSFTVRSHNGLPAFVATSIEWTAYWYLGQFWVTTVVFSDEGFNRSVDQLPAEVQGSLLPEQPGQLNELIRYVGAMPVAGEGAGQA